MMGTVSCEVAMLRVHEGVGTASVCDEVTVTADR